MELADVKDVPKENYKKAEIPLANKDFTNKPKPIISQVNEKPMGFYEKKQLCENIKKIDPKYLKGVLDIVRECTDMKGKELEFDIDKLPAKVCRELDKYIKQCMQGNNKNSSKRPVVTEVNRNRIEPKNNLNKEPEVVESHNPNTDVYIPESEPSSESSSTSESEEEVPEPVVINTQGFSQKNDENEFTGGFGSMIDFDKFY